MCKKLIVLSFLLSLAACSSFAPAGRGPVSIRMGGQPGVGTEVAYFNSSRILSYADGQIVKDRKESVDFAVVTTVKAVDPTRETIEYIVKTIRKDGAVDLRDLAFPELNESLDYTIKRTGEVLRAGRLPSHSIFFVPSMPVPDQPVSVGDTWTLEHIWRSARDGVPLMLALVAILKGVVPCESKGLCADIEISGHVRLVMEPTAQNAKFSTRIWGRMLFSLDRGDLLWSFTRSREDVGAGSGRVVVSSCMVSSAKVGEGLKRDKLTCEPEDDAIPATPRF